MGGISQSQRISPRSEAPEPTSGSPTQGSCTRKTSPRTPVFEKKQGLCSGEPPREAGGKPNSPWGGDAGSSHWGHPFYQGNTALASDTSESSPSLLVVEAYPPTSRRAPGPRPGRQQWEAYLTLQQACTHHMWQASHPGWGPVPPTSAPITEAPP